MRMAWLLHTVWKRRCQGHVCDKNSFPLSLSLILGGYIELKPYSRHFRTWLSSSPEGFLGNCLPGLQFWIVSPPCRGSAPGYCFTAFLTTKTIQEPHFGPEGKCHGNTNTDKHPHTPSKQGTTSSLPTGNHPGFSVQLISDISLVLKLSPTHVIITTIRDVINSDVLISPAAGSLTGNFSCIMSSWDSLC